MYLGAGHAEAAFAPGVFGEGELELGLVEVGPEDGGEDDLGVGGLQEQEVAEAELAGGTDDEVRIGQAGGLEAGFDGGPVDRVGLQPAGGDVRGERTRGGHDLLAGAVVQRDDEVEGGVVLARLDDVLQR